MFKNILLATDFSEHSRAAKKAAISLARESDKKLTVLHVFNQHDFSLKEGVFLASESIEEYEKEIHEEKAKLILDEFCREIEEQGINPQKVVKEGIANREIINFAKELKADLIVIGSHSKRNIFDVMLGGTANSVSQNAPCPVLIASHLAENK